MDCSSAEIFTIEEEEYVQIMHVGTFDDEPDIVAKMNAIACYLRQI